MPATKTAKPCPRPAVHDGFRSLARSPYPRVGLWSNGSWIVRPKHDALSLRIDGHPIRKLQRISQIALQKRKLILLEMDVDLMLDATQFSFDQDLAPCVHYEAHLKYSLNSRVVLS